MTRWCDAHQDLVLYRGHCFIHRAEVTLVAGALGDAVEAARHACDRLAEPVNLGALAGATYLEAEVLRVRGDFDGADAAYVRANEIGREPQPGLALLRLAQGRQDAAEAMIRRVASETEGPIARSWVLAAFVEIVLRGGDVEAAREAAEELRTVATELGTPMLRAVAARAAGAIHLASGDATAALLELRRALKCFVELEAPIEAARTRLLVGQACACAGDSESAALEERTALAALEACGVGVRDADGAPAPELPDGLTERELGVLLLLAQGKTNRVIGEELFISEKTVASHVSHIFTKLGVGSRAAATAYAYDKGLV